MSIRAKDIPGSTIRGCIAVAKDQALREDRERCIQIVSEMRMPEIPELSGAQDAIVYRAVKDMLVAAIAKIRSGEPTKK